MLELTATPHAGGSVSRAMAVALGLATVIVAFVRLGSCLVPTRRIVPVDAREAMQAES